MTDCACEALVTRTPAIHPASTTNRNVGKRRIAELEARVGELDAYAGAVTHDLRAPLRAVHGFARALEEDHGAEMSEGARGFVTRIITAAREMERLIDDLLALSRTGVQADAMAQVNQREIVDQVLADLAPARADKIHAKIGWLGGCYGYAGLLRQLWTNLLSNAFKFTRERDPAVIEIGSFETGAGVIYFVRDNGVGFDMDCARDLFLPYRRFHDPREYEGHGIGLATVQRIVSCHGGRAWADARRGEGATFYFTLAASNPGLAAVAA